MFKQKKKIKYQEMLFNIWNLADILRDYEKTLVAWFRSNSLLNIQMYSSHYYTNVNKNDLIITNKMLIKTNSNEKTVYNR